MEHNTSVKNDFSNSNSNNPPDHHSDTNNIPIKLVIDNKGNIGKGAIRFTHDQGLLNPELPRSVGSGYAYTSEKKPCPTCGDKSGKCGIGYPSPQRTICFSFSESEAQAFCIENPKYVITEYNSEFNYSKFYCKVEPWNSFEPVINQEDLLDYLDLIPQNWALTPLKDKKPYRKNWQTETPLDRDEIKQALLGLELISKRGNPYKSYSSGYGLRTGDISDGLLAIDVDGSSAEPLLQKISNGDIPKTIKWTSGKPGRYQILFKISDERRPVIANFNKIALKKINELECNHGEQLEFRYNGMQSVLPPSRHPDTGSYKWINSPEDTEVAIAPQWLIDYLPKLVAKESEFNQKQPRLDNNYRGSNHTYSPILGNIDEIPVLEILPSKAKELINQGAGAGERNDTCLRISTIVVSVIEGCQRRGINTIEKSARDGINLILDYARNCNPPMDDNEAIGVYERAIKFNPNDVLPDDFYHKKARKYLRERNPNEYKRLYGKSFKNKVKTPDELAEDNAQFETEKAIHKQLSGFDEEALKELGIKITHINKPNLSSEDLNLEKHKISIPISAMGTCKTSAIAEKKDSFYAIYSYHTRNSLAWTMAEKMGALHKEEAENNKFAKKVTFCANSADKFDPRNLKENGLLLGDECDQLFAYLFEPLCNRDSMRPRLLAFHQAHLASALTDGSALYMSAHVAQKEIEYIFKCAPKNTPIEVIINNYKPQRGKIILSTDKSLEALVSHLLKNLKQGVPCFIIDDNKDGYKGCKTIAEYVRQELIKSGINIESNPDLIVEINSDTSEDINTKTYITDINNRSLNTLLLVCSPSVISGVSIENKRFDNVYGFFNGILTPKNACQALSRARGAENLFVWCAERGTNYEASRGITPADVNAYYQKNYDARNKFLTSFAPDYNVMSEEWKSHHWELFCKNAALKNIEMRRLRYWLKEQLIEDGYQIEEVEFGLAPNVNDSMKEIWGQLKLEEINEIDDCELITSARYKELREKSSTGINLSKEERLQLTKYYLLDTFGEEIINTCTVKLKDEVELHGFAAIAYKNWGNKLEKSLRRLHRNFYKPIEDVAADDIAGESRQAKLRPDFEGCNQRFPGDIKWQLRERKFFEFLEFEKYLDPNKNYYPNDYQPVIDKIRQHSEAAKLAMGINFENANDGLIIYMLYAMCGLSTGSKQVTVDGKRIRVKWITKDSWEFAQNFIAHQEAKKAERDRCTTPPILLVNDNFKGGVVQEPESLPSNQHSQFYPSNAQATLTPPQQEVSTPKYTQLDIDFKELSEYLNIPINDYLEEPEERDDWD